MHAMHIDLKSGWGRMLSAALGIGALLVTVGCGTRVSGASGASGASGMAGHALNASQAGAPVVVTCEPHQRTVVRPVVVNGAMMSEVECVAAGQIQAVAEQGASQMAAPVQNAYRPAAQPVYDDLGDARVVPVRPRSSTVARPVQTRQVVYERAPVRGRSVKKSAIIIGSSAGVGAGVGAAVGGKKGALIGAAIGGGSAAIWDQVTRR
jgi:hypothetical protein